MAFPNSHVLCALIDEYLGHKEIEWPTLRSRAGEKINYLAAVFKTADPILQGTAEGQKSTHAPEQKRQICDELKASFAAAKNIEQWISIIRTLGNLARQAQNEKTGPGDSDFCWTLHAIRNYIIAQIHPHITVQLYPSLCSENERGAAATEKNAESVAFSSEIDRRKQDARQAEEHIGDLQATATSTKNADIELDKILFDRANLGDTRAATQATTRGVFAGMDRPATQVTAELTTLALSLKRVRTNDNPNWPTCYQIDFYRILFERFIQAKREAAHMMKWSSWEQFEAKAKAGQYTFKVDRPDLAVTVPPESPHRTPTSPKSPLATLSVLAAATSTTDTQQIPPEPLRQKA